MIRIILAFFIFLSLVYPLSLFLFDLFYYSFKGDFITNRLSDRAFSRIILSITISITILVISLIIFIIYDVNSISI